MEHLATVPGEDQQLDGAAQGVNSVAQTCIPIQITISVYIPHRHIGTQAQNLAAIRKDARRAVLRASSIKPNRTADVPGKKSIQITIVVDIP